MFPGGEQARAKEKGGGGGRSDRERRGETAMKSVSMCAPTAPSCDNQRAAGYAGLDDRALLGLMLRRSGADRERLAATLLDRFGGLGEVLSAELNRLAEASGASPAILADLGLLRELTVRLARAEACRRPVITSWGALIGYVRVSLAHQPREQFRALYLDRRNILLRDELTAEGTIDHAPVYPREVVRRALDLSASALILVHNHPSGDPTPSRADIEMTRKIVDAARLFGIQVHDHLVVGREGTASFKSLGLI